jgi:hypothetical protein
VAKRYERVDYTEHALVQMRRRNIDKAQVERCLESPVSEAPSKTFPQHLEAQYDTEFSTLFIWYEVLAPSHALVWSAVRRKRRKR